VSALEEIKEAIFRCALELSERSDSESAGDTGFSSNTGEEGGDCGPEEEMTPLISSLSSRVGSGGASESLAEAAFEVVLILRVVILVPGPLGEALPSSRALFTLTSVRNSLIHPRDSSSEA